MEIRQWYTFKHLLRWKRQVYLDHNATTAVHRKVRRRMNRVLKRHPGNPSSIYGLGRNAAELMETARQHVADAIHAGANEIVFTGCATESNNMVLQSLSRLCYPERRKIISTPIEHPSVMATLSFLETQGIEVVYCPVDHEGRVKLTELARLIDEQTFLVCCMLANNEIGTIQDLRAIVNVANRHGALVLSDCVQALGKIPVNVRDLGVDYASFSAHKLHGPKGVGALYVRNGSPLQPLIHGGHQEEGLRAGTESLHNIAGFGEACRQVNRLLAEGDRLHRLKERFIMKMKAIHPGCTINSPKYNGLTNTISITLPGIRNTGMIAMLDYYGISVSAGSACSSDEDQPSHVLKAIGLTDRSARKTIRISMGHSTVGRDLRYTLKVFRKCLDSKQFQIDMISPAQLNERILFDENIFILDIRPPFLRGGLKSLPNAHVASFFLIRKYLDRLPRNKHILVVCQHGNLSYATSYYLKSKGFGKVSSLLAGIKGWKETFSELYFMYGGQNVRALA